MTEKTTDNYIKKPMSDITFKKLIVPSVIGIILCMLCLCGTTFAWLSDTTESGKNTITSGFFDVSVEYVYKNADTNIRFYPDADNKYLISIPEGALTAGEGINLSYTRVKNASNGYIVIELLDKDKKQIPGSVTKAEVSKWTPKNDPYYPNCTLPSAPDGGALYVRVTPYFGVMPK